MTHDEAMVAGASRELDKHLALALGCLERESGYLSLGAGTPEDPIRWMGGLPNSISPSADTDCALSLLEARWPDWSFLCYKLAADHWMVKWSNDNEFDPSVTAPTLALALVRAALKKTKLEVEP